MKPPILILCASAAMLVVGASEARTHHYVHHHHHHLYRHHVSWRHHATGARSNAFATFMGRPQANPSNMPDTLETALPNGSPPEAGSPNPNPANDSRLPD